MKFQLTSFHASEMVGKTIHRFVNYRGGFILFIDNYFVIFKSSEVEGLSAQEIMTLDEMIDYEIITKEEADKIKSDREKEVDKVNKETRYQEFEYIKQRYEILKKEFGE